MKTSELLAKWEEARNKYVAESNQYLTQNKNEANLMFTATVLNVVREAFDRGFEAAVKILDTN